MKTALLTADITLFAHHVLQVCLKNRSLDPFFLHCMWLRLVTSSQLAVSNTVNTLMTHNCFFALKTYNICWLGTLHTLLQEALLCRSFTTAMPFYTDHQTILLLFYRELGTLWRVLYFNSQKYTSVTPLRKSLHCLPVQQRITFKLDVVCYNVEPTKTPAYLHSLLCERIPTEIIFETITRCHLHQYFIWSTSFPHFGA